LFKRLRFARCSIEILLTYLLRQLPDKFSAADSIPTSILKQVIDVIAPSIVALFNRSLAAGHFPADFKEAFITPIVKKPGLDVTDVRSYRPISNLSVLSKLLERLVARQLRDYLTSADLLPPLQSGFRPGHLTETAVLRVLSDILQAVDRGNSAALVLLDLSAAFDTVDHEILLQRLRATFGIYDTVHQWFRSYLLGRTQYVRRGLIKSSKVHLTCGVPQGSVLGPLLFILYTADLTSLIENSGFSPNLYADDSQVYGSCRPVDVDTFSSNFSDCVGVISNWMRSNRLQLNSDKTEVLWCSTSRRQHQLPTTALLIDGVPVTRLHPSEIWGSTSMRIWSCGHTFNEQYRDALLRSGNYVRSAAPCRRPRSSHWWSLW
jgi:Reverse transcriptase (RNA-dependent DNA polymerase)